MGRTPLLDALACLLIGLLLGLERERSTPASEARFAGIRTFPLLVLAGYLAALAGEEHGMPLALPALILAVGGLAVAAYLRSGREQVGTTTEFAAVLAPLLGALVSWDQVLLAASLAVVVTLLLTLKSPLHRIAGGVSEEEIVAILKFGIVGIVLVPLLPTHPWGPYGAIVPRQVGYVVLILSGLSLAGYLAVRLVGGRAGWALVGLLGGFVSSTAVTLSLSGKSRDQPGLARALAVGMILASTVLYLRALFVVGLFDTTTARYLAPRLAVLFLAGLASASVGYPRGTEREGEGAPVGNPVELGRAAALGGLFALILLGARFAQETLGSTGLWAAGAVGGLIDVDSVAVAAARLRSQGLATVEAAGGSFLLATVSNLVVKGGIVALVGGRGVARRTLPALAGLGVATLLILWLW